uniref:Uncharacterized protein n=1 Tax=Romanomermis culicivorax TaxID=13658 RepID=A0A915IYC2_ROMCU
MCRCRRYSSHPEVWGRLPSFTSKPRTYICNRFALRPIVFDEEFHMETSIEEIQIDVSDYTANPHSATATQITDFSKLTLREISTIALAPMDESTPIQPAVMDSQTMTSDQIMMDIPEESTVDQPTSMDVVPIEPAATMPPTAPALDPWIYLLCNGTPWLQRLLRIILGCHLVCCFLNTTGWTILPR